MGYFLTLVSTFLIFTVNSAQASDREWEQWDKDNVSQIIDNFWLSSYEELEHRKKLSALTKQWIFQNDHLLEIGCGSGLVYNALVPDVLPNHAYVGIDISETMLDIATKRYPNGMFKKDDLYALSFPDNSFEMVVAFEVFGHLPDISKPIKEMFRTSSRTIIFTVWTGPSTKLEQEVIENAVFIHTTFSHIDVVKAINTALETEFYYLHTQQLPGNKTAYIIHKY